jgi:segregation and condensation protein B
MAQFANLTDATEARILLDSLRRRYDERGCAFQVAQVAGGYQLLSRPKFAQWLRPLAAREQEIRLSPPALETLAVVAHRQPVLRSDIEAIRGVGCGEILRQLMDRDLLRIVGRSEELGRPLWYGTTRRFLQVFGLCNLEQLPLADQLRRRSGEDELGVESTQVLPDLDAGLTGEAGAA